MTLRLPICLSTVRFIRISLPPTLATFASAQPCAIDRAVEDVTGARFFDPNLDRARIGDPNQDSPYPEVRSAVANTDDPEMPCSTIRAWILGVIMAVIIAGINQFLYVPFTFGTIFIFNDRHVNTSACSYFRYPSVMITQIPILLVSLPLGRGIASILPDVEIFGAKLSPGPFTIKEHVLVLAMTIVGAYPAYATDIIAVQRVFYNQQWSFACQCLFFTQLSWPCYVFSRNTACMVQY